MLFVKVTLYSVDVYEKRDSQFWRTANVLTPIPLTLSFAVLHLPFAVHFTTAVKVTCVQVTKESLNFTLGFRPLNETQT